MYQWKSFKTRCFIANSLINISVKMRNWTLKSPFRRESCKVQFVFYNNLLKWTKWKGNSEKKTKSSINQSFVSSFVMCELWKVFTWKLQTPSFNQYSFFIDKVLFKKHLVESQLTIYKRKSPWDRKTVIRNWEIGFNVILSNNAKSHKKPNAETNDRDACVVP